MDSFVVGSSFGWNLAQFESAAKICVGDLNVVVGLTMFLADYMAISLIIWSKSRGLKDCGFLRLVAVSSAVVRVSTQRRQWLTNDNPAARRQASSDVGG